MMITQTDTHRIDRTSHGRVFISVHSRTSDYVGRHRPTIAKVATIDGVVRWSRDWAVDGESFCDSATAGNGRITARLATHADGHFLGMVSVNGTITEEYTDVNVANLRKFLATRLTDETTN